MAEIPKVLVERLSGLGPRFIKVLPREKKPFEDDWQKPEMLMNADDPRLREWLENGGNYGVAAGYGLNIIEADTDEVKKIIDERLPKSLMGWTPGHKGYQYYFLGSFEKKINLRNGDGEHAGAVLGPGFMVVGPGSIHPCGGRYTLINDAPLAQVSREQLIQALSKFVIPEKEVAFIEEAARREKQQDGVDLDILRVVPLAGLKKQGDEYYGAHPVHGSTLGRNFWVNPRKNCWHCFRHSSGGGPLLWLAVEEGLIRCEEAGPGALKGELFKQVLQRAVDRGLIKEGQVNLKKQEQGINLGDFRLELRGSAVIVVDKFGEPLWSTKITSLTGLQTKRDLAKKLKLEENVVDHAVAKFMLQAATKESEFKTAAENSNSELAEKAHRLLRDPKLLATIVQALRDLGLVGETRNGLVSLIDMVSAKARNPINRRWTGRSGVGKTTIVVKVASLLPPEMLMVLSGATKKTLWYHPDTVEVDENTRVMDLAGKILILLEESESKEFLDEIKPLLSHDKHELTYTFVEKFGNVNVTRKMVLRGWPVYIGITTEPELREEQQTRALLGTPDYGREKWRAVIAADATNATKLQAETESSLVPLVQEAIRQLKTYNVWMPWLPLVGALFPHEDAKSMREWMFFHSFLDSIAILLQEQLPKVVVNGQTRLAAPVSILELAGEIAKAGFAETISKLPRDVCEFADHLARQEGQKWTYKELQREYVKRFGGSIPLSTLKTRYIEKLVDEGILEIDDSKKPYVITVVEKRSTSLTVFEKALEIIHSGEIKPDLIQKRSSTTDTQVKQLLAYDEEGKPISPDALITTLYSARLVDDVKESISRIKSEEYALPSLFSESVDLVNRFFEKNADSSLGETSVRNKVKPDDVASLATTLNKTPLTRPEVDLVTNVQEGYSLNNSAPTVEIKNKANLEMKAPTMKMEEEKGSEDKSPHGVCWLCNRLLPGDLKNTTVLEGKYVHLGCYMEWRSGQKVNESAKLEPPPSSNHYDKCAQNNGEGEKGPGQRLSIQEMLELLHNDLPKGKEYSEQQFLDCAVKHGWTRQDHDSFFQKLVDDGTLLRTPEGNYVWT